MAKKIIWFIESIHNNYYKPKISSFKNVYISSHWRSKFQVSSHTIHLCQAILRRWAEAYGVTPEFDILNGNLIIKSQSPLFFKRDRIKDSNAGILQILLFIIPYYVKTPPLHRTVLLSCNLSYNYYHNYLPICLKSVPLFAGFFSIVYSVEWKVNNIN